MDALRGFLERVRGDQRIGPLHISLYVVLLELCEGEEGPGMFAICRVEVMAKAKIRGKTTYYKCMKELSDWGYVVYLPGRRPGDKSGVRVVGVE
jgi:hypothetical protein